MSSTDNMQAATDSGLMTGERAEFPSVPARSRRMLLAWSASTLPVTPLLVVGLLFGPHGIAVFSPRVLSVLDPAIPVALGALGILLGLSLSGRERHDLSFLAGGAQASLTAGLVGFGLLGASTIAGGSIAGPAWFLPLFASVCAAAAITLPGRQPTDRRRLHEAIAESEVAVMIVAGGLLVAIVRTGSLAAGALLFAQACGVAALLATAGWLLVRNTANIIETRVFAFATLLLVGGAADYLSFSSLVGGLVTGLLWQRMGGPSCERLQRETLYAQHPFVVLVLVVAGARTELSALTIGLGAAYVVARIISRLAGEFLLSRSFADASMLRFRLLDSGIFGVAFALNLGRALGSDAATTLSVVVIGTILSDITLGLVSTRGVNE